MDELYMNIGYIVIWMFVAFVGSLLAILVLSYWYKTAIFVMKFGLKKLICATNDEQFRHFMRNIEKARAECKNETK